MDLTFGVFIPQGWKMELSSIAEPVDKWTKAVEIAELAEQLGYDSLWVTERYFHEETFSLLGFLAAATETVKLGVGVTNPYTRHPALLAMASATLDRISGGRNKSRPARQGKR